MEKLHPGAKWLFRIQAYLSIIIIIFILFGFGMSVLVNSKMSNKGVVISVLILILVLVWVIISEIFARLSYKYWLYDFGPQNLKLERGIIWKRYSNIPYTRVQNVDIHRGIIARMLGFSTVDIQTAGAHFAQGRQGARSEGHIPALSMQKAEEIREFLMKKIGSKQGL